MSSAFTTAMLTMLTMLTTAMLIPFVFLSSPGLSITCATRVFLTRTGYLARNFLNLLKLKDANMISETILTRPQKFQIILEFQPPSLLGQSRALVCGALRIQDGILS